MISMNVPSVCHWCHSKIYLNYVQSKVVTEVKTLSSGIHSSNHLAMCILVQVKLRTEVPRTPISTQTGFELMNSRLWWYTSYVTETPALTTRPSVTFLILDVVLLLDIFRIPIVWYLPWQMILVYPVPLTLWSCCWQNKSHQSSVEYLFCCVRIFQSFALHRK